ncbi:MAG TPA: hypothetical protein VLT32_02310 [Candidatus Sulfomarinibacteraceae bacterium]|nr:hypothetical protein [Candidatus Sulfomarinibacteraceae bacterium]
MREVSGRVEFIRAFCASLLAVALIGVVPAAADGDKGTTTEGVETAYGTITSAGPLDEIFAGVDAATQISYISDTDYQVYPPSTIPADYGTFVVVNGVLYAPDFTDHGSTATSSLGTYTVFTQVSQSTVTGSGTAADPYEITTVVDVGTTGLRITQLDSYVVGEEQYRTDVTLANSTGSPVSGILYRAMDCYLAGSDDSYGMQSGTSVGCSATPFNSPPGRIELLDPITGGNNYYQAEYSEVWAAIGTHLPFDDTCRCNELIDTGAGISWNFTVPASGSVTYSHYSVFSPTGGQPPAPEPGIPTLGGLGIALLAGLLLAIGILAIRRFS